MKTHAASRRFIPAFLLMYFFAFGATSANSYDIQNQSVNYQVTSGRIISVNGSATIQIYPDRALIRLAVKNWNVDPHSAYEENDRRCKKVLALASTYHIEPQNIQTSEISVAPTYPGDNGSYSYTPRTTKPAGYEVERTIRFVLKDLKAVPELLTQALAAGATNISSVQFDASSLRKVRDDARILALRAAKEKAEALAHEFGSKIGKALVVNETGSEVKDLSSDFRAYSTSNNIVRSDNFSGETYGTVAPGQLMVSSSIGATFEVIDLTSESEQPISGHCARLTDEEVRKYFGEDALKTVQLQQLKSLPSSGPQ